MPVRRFSITPVRAHLQKIYVCDDAGSRARELVSTRCSATFTQTKRYERTCESSGEYAKRTYVALQGRRERLHPIRECLITDPLDGIKQGVLNHAYLIPITHERDRKS